MISPASAGHSIPSAEKINEGKIRLYIYSWLVFVCSTGISISFSSGIIYYNLIFPYVLKLPAAVDVTTTWIESQ